MTLRHRTGLSALTLLFLLASAAIFGLAAQQLVGSGARVAVETMAATKAALVARSGVSWVAHRLADLTTADRTTIEGLNGTSRPVGTDGARFSLALVYLDPDNTPTTDDTVVVTVTGDDGSTGLTRAESISLVIPAIGGGALFADDFTQVDTTLFDGWLAGGETATPHGAIIPLLSIAGGGDPTGLITHGSEGTGTPGLIRLSTTSELRLSLFTGDCFSLNVGGVCPGGCLAGPGCLVREGLAIPLDPAGFQNYFIKIRFRLLSGGFGVYFRTSYPNQGNPATVDLGGLTGYLWSYDPSLGYILPCSVTSALLGSDGMGMLATRRIEGGSETCGALCAFYTAPAPSYPFFCPENRIPWPPVDGWRWQNTNWFGQWRTLYLYVYRDRMTVWLGRGDIIGAPGSELDPSLVGTVPLGSITPLLTTGDLGLRLFATGTAAVADLDYLQVYPNDADYAPATFPGF